MNGFNFNILVKSSQDCSPEGLMQSYAHQHPSTSFGYDADGRAYLDICGTRFYYSHWSAQPVSSDTQLVIVYLVEDNEGGKI